jgi:signal transduction histidine kinase
MFFKSVRFKVILLYMLLLTLTLLVFSLILYESLDKVLIGHLDDLLSSRAEGITNSITAYWQIVRQESQETASRAPAELQDKVSGPFLKIAQTWAEEKRKDPELMSIFVQILDTNGNLLVSSKSMPRIQPMEKEDMEDVMGGDDDFDTVRGELVNGKKIKFRVYTKPVIENDRVTYIIQVAGPISLVTLALKNLMLVLLVLLPLTVILAGLPGVFLARLTLKPVDNMIDTLRQITAENLKLKIHMPDTKDEIRRLANTFNDMIERLDRSFSSQQRFIQDISQELKIPMNMLKKEADNVLAGKCSDEEYRSFLGKVTGQIDGFHKTIEDLLVLSDSDNEPLVLEIKKVNLKSLVESALRDIAPTVQQKELAVSLSCRETIILDGDERRLKKLFDNILDNAAKYTYRRGRVTVSISREERFGVVSISDTGMGIPEDEMEYIFDRFYQVSRTRGSKSGFGLGLSDSKSIVEAHKGDISAESSLGKGSTFTVRLPLSYPG